MATLQNRNGSYRVLFIHGGRRQSLPLGRVPTTLAEAKSAKVEEILSLLKAGYLTLPDGMPIAVFLKHDGKPPARPTERPPEQSEATLGKLRDQYLVTHQGSLEANTLAGMQMYFRHLVATFGEGYRLDSLTLAELQRHADRRGRMKAANGKPISAVTVRKDFVAFRAAWNWGVGMGLVRGAFPQIKSIRLAKVEEKPPFQSLAEIERRVKLGGLSDTEIAVQWESLYLKPEEVAELLGHARGHATLKWVYPLVCTAAHTGARRSELLRMEAADVNIDEAGGGEVTIRERKRVRGVRSSRRVALTPFLAGVLRDWLRERPAGKYLFVNAGVIPRSRKRSLTTGHSVAGSRPSTEKGRAAAVRLRDTPGTAPLTIKEASDHFNRTLAGSKWAVVRGLHVLRHSFISACANKGVDQRMIDEWVGHTTEEQRKRYRHLYPSTQRAAIRDVFGG